MSSKPQILVVDDESSIREFLAQIISKKYDVLTAKDGTEALQIAKSQLPTLILLDVLMPGMNGISVCQELRENASTAQIPVVMLTAVADIEQRTEAFVSGADDYISKPFHPHELLARIESKLRRLNEKPTAITSTIKFGNLTLNFQEFKVDISGEEIEIGQIEMKILNCLIKNQGKLVERQALQDFVWGERCPSERALDPHITMLRKKLKNSRSELKTVYGRGFSIVLLEQAF